MSQYSIGVSNINIFLGVYLYNLLLTIVRSNTLESTLRLTINMKRIYNDSVIRSRDMCSYSFKDAKFFAGRPVSKSC
jgi:hypothetical protein